MPLVGWACRRRGSGDKARSPAAEQDAQASGTSSMARTSHMLICSGWRQRWWVVVHPGSPYPEGSSGVLLPWDDGFWRASIKVLSGAFATRELSGLDMYFDGSKAERELGYPRVGARAAVEDAWAWYQHEGLL